MYNIVLLYLINVYTVSFNHYYKIMLFQKSIVDWDIAGMSELKNYGHLISDGELKIKAHNDQKLKPR